MAQSACCALWALYPGSGMLRAALWAGDLRWDEGFPRAGWSRAAVPVAGPRAAAEPVGALPVHSRARSRVGRGIDPRIGGGGPALGAVTAWNVALHPADGDCDRDVSRSPSIEQLHLLCHSVPRGCVLQGRYEPGSDPGIGPARAGSEGRPGRGKDRAATMRPACSEPRRRRRRVTLRCCGWTVSSIATWTKSVP